MLEISGLTFRYAHASQPSLVDIDLEVDPGEFVVVSGASGSGKSSLLRAATGLVPHFHGGEIAGEVKAVGLSTRGHGVAALSGSVACLFQDPESQVAMGSVDAELALGMQQRGEAPAAVARAVEEISLALGIPHLRGRATADLSGGELQRVVLGSVLAGGPDLLLLDEPTAQLDPVAADELVGLLRRLNEEHGLAVIIAEHRIERWLAAADRVVALDHGHLVCEAAPQAYLEWAIRTYPELASPLARMFAQAGLDERPVDVKRARAQLNRLGIEVPRKQLAPGRPAPRRWRKRSPAAIEIEGLWHELRRGREVEPILRGVSLTIEAGERVALVGRNGAGKSTLLRHLVGLARPTRGRLKIAGADGGSLDRERLARRTALLTQCPTDYFLHERVGDELPPDSAERALAAAGLGEHADADPRDLSGGERQRLALAIVLAGRGWPDGEPPPVVALDEPTRGMDLLHRRRLVSTLGRVANDGAAVIVATHDMELVAEFASRVVVLGNGAVVADGKPADVFDGGWHFTTDVAKALSGSGAIRAEEGAQVIQAALGRGVPA